MQRRERLLALGVGLLVGGWALDAAVIEPGLAWLADVRKEAHAAATAAAEARILVERSPRIMAQWRGWHAAGVLDDEGAARFRLQQAIASAAHDSGATIDSLGGGQRNAAAQGQSYDTLRLAVSGQGSLGEVQAFLATLETSAAPLAIERCELACRDPRKDAIDLSLTVSTRIVTAKAAAGRAVPAGTVPWTLPARDATLDRAVHDARPFAIDRHVPAKTTATATGPVVAAPAATWALVGVVTRDGQAIGFLRHLGTGEERTVKTGDAIGDETIATIDDAGLRLGRDGAARTVAIGTDLAGHPIPGGRLASAVKPGTTAAPSSAGTTTPTATANADRDAILQRLRERRNRASGNAP